MVRAPSVCAKVAGPIAIKELGDKCRVGAPPEPRCDHRRRLTRTFPSLPGLWATYTHRNCTCNEYISLRNRVLGKVPRPTEAGLRALRAEARVVSRLLPRTGPITIERFLEHYSGKRRTRYQNAADDLAARPLCLPRDAQIQAFVKSEKFNPMAKVNPDPRMIQARNARYNISVGVYLKPIEHHLYRLKDTDGSPLLAKGKSPWERGECIGKIWASFNKPVAVSLDGSRWDQHVDYEVLKIEHGVYTTVCRDPEFAKLLECQLVNRCKTQGGWRYVAYGKRMSGDMNTALGNCLLMVIMARACLKQLGIKGKIFDDGDDILVFVEQDDLPTLRKGVSEVFLGYGQEVKLENIAYRLEDIVFCQAKPVIDNRGRLTMVSDWTKIISQSTAGTRYWDSPKSRMDMAFSVGQCLLALYPGMPIIQAYAQSLCKTGKMNSGIYDTDWIHKVRPTGSARELGGLGPEEITPETRNSFWAAYGVDPIQQQLLEEQLSGWTVPTAAVEEVTDEVRGDWEWQFRHPPAPTEWEWAFPPGAIQDERVETMPYLPGARPRMGERTRQPLHLSQPHPDRPPGDLDEDAGEATQGHDEPRVGLQRMRLPSSDGGAPQGTHVPCA